MKFFHSFFIWYFFQNLDFFKRIINFKQFFIFFRRALEGEWDDKGEIATFTFSDGAKKSKEESEKTRPSSAVHNSMGSSYTGSWSKSRSKYTSCVAKFQWLSGQRFSNRERSAALQYRACCRLRIFSFLFLNRPLAVSFWN